MGPNERLHPLCRYWSCHPPPLPAHPAREKRFLLPFVSSDKAVKIEHLWNLDNYPTLIIMFIGNKGMENPHPIRTLPAAQSTHEQTDWGSPAILVEA